MTSTPKQ